MNHNLLREDEQQIAERSKLASPGPWFWRKCYQLATLDGMARLWALKSPKSEADGKVVGIKGTLAQDYWTSPEEWNSDPDNEFIAHARADVPLLINRLIEARAEKYEFAAQQLEQLGERHGNPIVAVWLRDRADELRRLANG